MSGGLTSPAEVTFASILSSDSGAGLALAFEKSVFYGDPFLRWFNKFPQRLHLLLVARFANVRTCATEVVSPLRGLTFFTYVTFSTLFERYDGGLYSLWFGCYFTSLRRESWQGEVFWSSLLYV